MKYNHLSLYELMNLKYYMIAEGMDVRELDRIIEKKEIREFGLYEDTSGTGGPSGASGASSVGMGGGGVAYASAVVSGMGGVVSSQPSSYAGVTTDPGYSSGGGKSGSGDISVPYNPGGRKKVFQKVPVDNRKGTNRRRKNKMLSGLKQALGKKFDFTAGQGQVKPKKVMNWETFSKEELNRVTHL